MNMGTILILISIGLLAGILSGFVGVGGGIIMVPALVFFLGLTQFEAQGTSLAIMIPPVGILAVMNYWKTGNVNINYAIVICATFIIGGYLGSKLSLKLPQNTVKLVFGFLMLFAAVRIIWSSLTNILNQSGS